MATVPEQFHDLFERQTIAAFSTTGPDGWPHVTPVWPDLDDGDVLVNTERGRRKERNARHDPKVGVCIWDPEDVYRFVSVQGTVAEITEEGAVEHVDSLARQYWDVESHAERAGEGAPRVIIRIRPDRIMSSATSKSGGE